MSEDRNLKFCGKVVTVDELSLIKELAEEFWGIPQTELANTVCELLGWERANGKLKTVECRQFLQRMEEAGLIKMPRKRSKGKSKNAPVKHTDDGRARAQITGSVHALGGALLQRVESPQQLQEWKELVDRYHYLGHKQAFGAQLRYLVRCREQGRVLGCLQFSSPAWKVQARDRWIGWDQKQREANLQRIVQNSRFLILPWVEVKGLASHVLGRANRRLADDWQALYGYRPLLMETFVEARFRGTSYAAANWLKLGETQGRGRMDRDHQHNESKKTVWVYPLHRRARQLLSESSA